MFKELSCIKGGFEIKVLQDKEWKVDSVFESCCKHFLSKVPTPMQGWQVFKYLFSKDSQVISFHLINLFRDPNNKLNCEPGNWMKFNREFEPLIIWPDPKETLTLQAPKLHTLKLENGFKVANITDAEQECFQHMLQVESFKAMSNVQVSFRSLKELVVGQFSFQRKADGCLELTSPDKIENMDN